MPNTREKLIEIFESAERPITVPHRMDAEQARKYVFGEMADHLIANGVTVQKWIPVTERLPENDYGKHWKERRHYLVRFNPSGLMCVAHYGYKEYDWWIDEHDCVLSATNYKEVTHWMPLPEPPKGE